MWYVYGLKVLESLFVLWVVLHLIGQLVLWGFSFINDKKYECKDFLFLGAFLKNVYPWDKNWIMGDYFLYPFLTLFLLLAYPLLPIIGILYCMRFGVRCSKSIIVLGNVAHKHKNKKDVIDINVEVPKFK